jgi:hypothetical protein
MTGLAAAEAMTPKSGGTGEQDKHFGLSKEWRGVAVLYARDGGGVVEISALYESHIPKEIKDELAARFGIGIHEWRVTR